LQQRKRATIADSNDFFLIVADDFVAADETKKINARLTLFWSFAPIS